MQTFKTFFKISKKHLPSCILYLGIYVVIMILLSFLAQDSNDSQFQASSLDIGIIDCDESKASHRAVSVAVCAFFASTSAFSAATCAASAFA